jgi:hypothetical protein
MSSEAGVQTSSGSHTPLPLTFLPEFFDPARLKCDGVDAPERELAVGLPHLRMDAPGGIPTRLLIGEWVIAAASA